MHVSQKTINPRNRLNGALRNLCPNACRPLACKYMYFEALDLACTENFDTSLVHFKVQYKSKVPPDVGWNQYSDPDS